MSLPHDWIIENNLQKSSEIELETDQSNISIFAGSKKNLSKEVTISYPLPEEENIVANIIGAYLFGFDIIKIQGKKTIPNEDREKIRGSLRRLVGLEIIEEDSSNIHIQFLLDSASLKPDKIFKRMSSIALGMYKETLNSLISENKKNLETLPNRDDEIDRQYFLLVRLLRSTVINKNLADIFHLENIDILDYRIASHLLELAGDIIVELINSILKISLTKEEFRKLYEIAKEIENIHKKSIEAFTLNDRLMAIEAIKHHKSFQLKISDLRFKINKKKNISIGFLDLLYSFEGLAKSLVDIADLVKPVYSKS